MNFKLISNLDEAKVAWQTLSPNKVIYDDWEFRYAYYKYFNYPLYFYAAYEDDELVALLPLMLNTDTNLLDFFAGFNYMEDNQIFTKKGLENVREELLKQIDKPGFLEYMSVDMKDLSGSFEKDYSYSLSISELKNHQDYIEKYWVGKSRNKRLKQIEEIESYKINVIRDQFEDLDKMIEFNKEKFKDYSAFIKRPFWKEFHKNLKDIFEVHSITLEIDDQIQAIAYGLKYGNRFTGLTWGYKNDIPNLGKYLILHMIDLATELGCDIYDAGVDDDGWKEMMYFEKRPLYAIVIKK